MTKPYPGLPSFNIESDEPPPPSKTSTDDTDSATPSRRKKHLQTRSAETLILRGVAVPLNSDVGGAFVTDASRNRERLFSDQRLIEKYGLTMAGWKEIAKNEAFLLAVAAEVERRTYNGDAARERAAKEFTTAPTVLGAILNDKSASPKHRIDAARELRTTANTGADKPEDTSDRYIITINLGADEKLVVDSGPLPRRQTKEAFDAE